jgi:signal transduction histidine kinase
MKHKKISSFYDTFIQLSFGCLAQLNDVGSIISFDSYIDQIPEEVSNTFVGQRWEDIFIPVDERYRKFKLSALIDASSQEPLKILTVYNETIYIEWKFLLNTDSNSSQDIYRLLGAGIDVTRHIELKQQLQHADRLATVGQLAAGIAHEINGPLNNILGYAQLSSKQQDLPEQVYQDLDNIIRMSLHAREVVKKVMLFSRQVTPKHDRIQINKVIRDSLYFTEPLCRQNELKILTKLDEKLPCIVGDFSQLRQVVVNLIVNSAQAMPDHGGMINIETHYENSGNVLLTIQDTGTGMTPETLNQCFLPFFTTKNVDEGTGLGLSVVHGIIQAHNAEIDVESRVKKGSKFTISFPTVTECGEKNVE